MKIALLFMAACLMSAKTSDQETKFKVELSMRDWQAVVSIIDNSATPGEVRKPLIYEIQQQVNAQLKTDSTKTKKP